MPGIEDIQPLMGIPSAGASVIVPNSVAGVLGVGDQIRQNAQQQLEAGLVNTPAAQAQRALAVQQAKEQLDAEAISARKAATSAALAQAIAAKANVNDQASLTEYHDTGLPTIYRTDGSPDNVAMANIGGQRLQAKQQLGYAAQGLQVVGQQQVPDKNSPTGWSMIYKNALGEDITPGYGNRKPSEIWQHYHDISISARDTLFGGHDLKVSGVESADEPEHFSSGPALPQTPPAAPMITPTIEGYKHLARASARATGNPLSPQAYTQKIPANGITPVVPIAQGIPGLPSASDADLGGPASAFIQPKTTTITTPDGTSITHSTPATPAVVPASAPDEAEPLGIPVMGDADKAATAWTGIQNREEYKNWATKAPAIRSLRHEIANPPKHGEVTNERDLNLAKTVLQIMSESASVRGLAPEMALHEIHEGQPLFESIKELKNVILKKEKFSPETRQRLIALGSTRAADLELGARGVIQSQAPGIARQNMIPLYSPNGGIGLLSPTEWELMNQKGGAAGASSPAAARTPVTIGGKTYFWGNQ